MYIQRNKKKVGSKQYESILLVHNVWENGRSRHKTILNLTKWDKEDIKAIEQGLKGKSGFSLEDVKSISGKSVGGLWVFKKIAEKMGIDKILGRGAKGKLALLLIIGRILTQGSRLHLCEWGEEKEIEAVLGIDKYNEDHLYETLDWLAEKQAKMEKKLFERRRLKEEEPTLFLYDITSSYLEGQKHAMGEYGYNRDGKRRKKQIVIGLITDSEGIPVTIEAFEGNTSDSTTVMGQIEKMAERFGVNDLIFVGDRGMIKSRQINGMKETHKYITAISKKQIQTLLKKNVIQMGLFDSQVAEVLDDKERYILRKNPIRQQEIEINRSQKEEFITAKIMESNRYLKEHPRAKTEIQEKKIKALIKKLNLSTYCDIKNDEKSITMDIDSDKREEARKLDGCYVIKTNIKAAQLDKDTVHDRYKDLALVEHAFRTIKTGCLEIRPIFVRKESRTRGHVFVSMLAHMMVQAFWKKVHCLGYTLDHAIDSMDAIQTIVMKLGKKTVKRIPDQPEKKVKILQALGIKLPTTLPILG
jgi:transposase